MGLITSHTTIDFEITPLASALYIKLNFLNLLTHCHFFSLHLQNTNPISSNYPLPWAFGHPWRVKSITRKISTYSPNSAGHLITLAMQSSFSSFSIFSFSTTVSKLSTLFNCLKNCLYFPVGR